MAHEDTLRAVMDRMEKRRVAMSNETEDGWIGFEDFVKKMTRQAHDALLREGSKGLRQAIFDSFWMYDQWKEKNKAKRKKSRK